MFKQTRQLGTKLYHTSMLRSFGTLVSADELALNLEHVKVLDGSWHMPNANRDPYKEFVQKRIKGAQFFGIDIIKDTTVDLPHMLPTSNAFADAVGKLGISQQDQVVVYDSAGVFSAARVYWTFKVFGHQNVSVLNGGLPKWINEGKTVESGEPAPLTETRYGTAQLQPKLVRDYASVLENAKNPTVQVLDARPFARFSGEAPEPRAGLESGHMPGSISIPFGDVIEGQLLKDDAKLRDYFESKGVDLDKEIITSCGSGITASILYLALERAGASKLAVYDGSWTEYADKKDSIITKSR